MKRKSVLSSGSKKVYFSNANATWTNSIKNTTIVRLNDGLLGLTGYSKESILLMPSSGSMLALINLRILFDLQQKDLALLHTLPLLGCRHIFVKK